MAALVSLFNHKGGVSKTTTTFNLGWALADLEYRVLMVDGDPQCNLTGTVLGFSGVDDFSAYYAEYPQANLDSCLRPVFQGMGEPLRAAQLTETGNDNLFLLAGHIDLAESETQISVALSASSAIPALQNIPGAASNLVRLTAEENEIDIVLVDMSPSVGALNQSLLMGSDFFIVPTSPDYYCNQAISSLARVLPNWNRNVRQFRSQSIVYRLPDQPPKFCGIISQRYRPRSGAPAMSFQTWIDIINESVSTLLVPALAMEQMTVSEVEFRNAGGNEGPYNLINIADFNSLIAQSQKYNTPVFALSNEQIEQTGRILEVMVESRENFRTCFQNLAGMIAHLCGLPAIGG